MKSNLKRALALALTLVVLFALCACGVKQTAGKNKDEQSSFNLADIDRKDAIILRAPDDIPSFDPAKQQGFGQSYLFRQMYDTLVIVDSVTGEIVGSVAESYDISEDGKTYTFHLRDDVRFTNGETLSSEDVVFTMERAKKSSYIKSKMTGVESFTAPDSTTVVVTLENPSALFLKHMTSLFLVSKNVMEAAGDSYDDHPVGTGPYMYDSYKLGDQLKFVRNDDYFKGAPSIKYLIAKIITDEATATIALQSGDVDYCEIAMSELENVLGDDSIAIHEEASSMSYFLVLNLKRDIFKDVNVRHALACACDSQFIVDTALSGNGSVACSVLNGIVMPDMSGVVYDYGYDVERATELLKQAGAEGLELTIKTIGGYEVPSSIIQQNFKEIGVNAQIKTCDAIKLLADAKLGNFDVILMSISVSDDPDTFTILLSEDGEYNMAFYENAEVEELFEQGRAETDPDKRVEIYTELINIVNEDMPYIPLVYDKAFYAYNKDLDISFHIDGGADIIDMSWN